MAKKIQVKRGLKADMPVLDIGEPALTTDEKSFYIGTSSGNIKLATSTDVESALDTLVSKSIKIDYTLFANTWISSDGLFHYNMWAIASDKISWFNMNSIVEMTVVGGSITSDQLIKLQSANVQGTIQFDSRSSAYYLVLYAHGTVPTINIPVTFIVRRDL